MNRWSRGLIGAALIAGAGAWADTKPNSYSIIVDQNIFRLKPIPVIDPSTTNPPPVAEKLPLVELTGITTLFSNAKALFEISDAPGKPPSKKPIMQVGDRSDNIELLDIDVANNQVSVRIGNVTSNITLRAPKAAPATPAAPGQPPIPAMAAAGAAAGNPQVINLGGGGSAGRGGGVVVAGGSSAPAAPMSGMPAATRPAATSMSGNISVAGGGLSSIPPRIPRISSTPSQEAISEAARQIITMKAQEIQARQSNVPFPPTPPIPGIDDHNSGQRMPPLPPMPGR